MMLPRCECGKELQHDEIVYAGTDWLTVAGKGSGFDFELHLICDSCRRIYHIGNLRKETGFAPLKYPTYDD